MAAVGRRWNGPKHDRRATEHEFRLPYIITFLLNLLIAYVLAQYVPGATPTPLEGAAIGVLLWVGIVAPFPTQLYVRDAPGSFRDQ